MFSNIIRFAFFCAFFLSTISQFDLSLSLLLSNLLEIAFILLSFSIFSIAFLVLPFFYLDFSFLPFPASPSFPFLLNKFWSTSLSCSFQSCSASRNPSVLLNFAPRPTSCMQPRSTTVIALEQDQPRIVYDPVNFPAELLCEEI